ncbi:ABC transporter ATP-binding protein [Actinomadura litoris]|uniref:ABC transporter ATP-binding protein n=1 Tax=Actinomadura litoris TaxID=2678616 RepID=UPI001FA6BC28|nr:ABC transporter ATP-binding protein [Actinomadura litoris]
MIRVSNLVKRYRRADRNAVDDIGFSVEAGEFFALLGPNGAGKTTTISILTTTLSKTSGSVAIAGNDVDRAPRRVRESIGVIFQKPSLDEELSAEENIRLHVSINGLYAYRPLYRMMPRSYRDRAGRLAELIGIGAQLFKPVRTFSGGMKRKLEIIRSLMCSPEVLFLDEPTSGLDPESRAGLWAYLQEVRERENTTVFLTTHYLEEAEAADRVCVVNHGRIALVDTPGNMKRRLIERYVLLDSPDRDALRGELADRRIEFVEGPELKVSYKDATPQRLISGLRTPLSVFRVHEPSLEDAYLGLLRRDERAEPSA